ncbi:MAG TPA: NAD-dependent epimerase/dehydratase family protein [Bacteroidetes bacterium]|nr:NAD-dependent epimerase/dehydratase family protein [Bacteroidota bacterium]
MIHSASNGSIPSGRAPREKTAPAVLLTGGTGLVGSHLLLELVKRGRPVLALKRPGSNTERVEHTWRHYGDPEQVKEWLLRVHWVDADLLDESNLHAHLKNIRKVVHAAAMVSFLPGRRNEMIRFNTESTRLLVNLCLEKKVEAFAHVSSVSTLGIPLFNRPADETLIGAPDKSKSGYALSKFFAENEVWRGIAEGLPAVIVNPSVVLGPGDWTRSSGRFFQAVWNGLNHYPEGGTGFVDVRDVARILVELVDRKCFGERFILSAGEWSYRELFESISGSLGRNPPRRKISPAMLEILWRLEGLRSFLTGNEPRVTRETAVISRHFSRFSSEKIRNLLGDPFRPLEETIQDTARYFVEEKS